jgi:hypothetical protein
VQLVIRLKVQKDHTELWLPMTAMMRGTNLLIGMMCLACLLYAWESATWFWGAVGASLNFWLALKPIRIEG